MMSLYMKSRMWYTAIASSTGGVVFGLLLAYFIFCPPLEAALDEAVVEKVVFEERLALTTLALLETEEQEEELSLLLSEAMDNYALLATFQEAGFRATSVNEIRSLLHEASKMPFGTPFAGGHRVTAEYGVYTIPDYGWVGVAHPGIDLVPLGGDYTVYSPVDSIISDFGYSTVWGKWIELTTATGYQLFFAHLDTLYFQTEDEYGNWSLEIGTPIDKGRRIGIMGATGSFATGIHLHYEIRILTDSGYRTLDPEAIIAYTGYES